MKLDITIIVTHENFPGIKFANRITDDIPNELISDLKNADQAYLIRSAMVKAVSDVEWVFLDELKGRVVNAMLEQPDGSLQHIYKDLNVKR